MRLDQLHPYIWMKYILPKCSVQEHKSLSMVNSAVRNIVTNYNANQVIGGPGLEKAEKGEGEFYFMMASFEKCYYPF